MRTSHSFAMLLAGLMLLEARELDAQPLEACYRHTFLADKPDEATPGWNQEAQGLTHDANYWYLVQNVEACVVPAVSLTSTAPSFFPLGTTTVAFTATDDFRNAASCSAAVSVQDTLTPTLTVRLDRNVLWTPNHDLVAITATLSVTDRCDPNATFVLTSITSNEPDEGLGDGDAPRDIQGAQFGTPDTSFLLRAERSGTGSGRVYTIVCTASDATGNTATAAAVVRVPHAK